MYTNKRPQKHWFYLCLTLTWLLQESYNAQIEEATVIQPDPSHHRKLSQTETYQVADELLTRLETSEALTLEAYDTEFGYLTTVIYPDGDRRGYHIANDGINGWLEFDEQETLADYSLEISHKEADYLLPLSTNELRNLCEDLIHDPSIPLTDYPKIAETTTPDQRINECTS